MFVHLRLHTEFSVIDGITRIDDAIRLAGLMTPHLTENGDDNPLL